MDPRKRIFISLIILVVLVVAFYYITYELSKSSASGYSVYKQNTEYDEFEKCLMGKNLVLYMNTSNTDETLKNIELIDYVQFFKVHNCFSNNQPCIDNNIESFPTSIIEGNRVVGKLTIEELSKDSGCKSM